MITSKNQTWIFMISIKLLSETFIFHKSDAYTVKISLLKTKS